MEQTKVRSLSSGLSQRGVRNHNERLVLTLVQRHGALPGSDLARLTGLSPPTVSTILRRLETEHLLVKGDPVRGKVGKPSIPLQLDADGAFAYGLKIGRRSAELLLMDITGTVRHQHKLRYDTAVPDEVFGFLHDGLAKIGAELGPVETARICGIGVAAPFEMWHWTEDLPPTGGALDEWLKVDFRAEVERIAGLPVALSNDATAACRAEHIFGRGKAFGDYAYFFVGAFVGGGIVLNHSVFEGRRGNAGALGSLRTMGPNGEGLQLIDTASIHVLEKRLRQVDLDPKVLWQSPQDWSGLDRHVEPWLRETAQELARAAISTCSVIDFEAVLIDGAFPPEVRADLVTRVRRYIAHQDTRGLIPPQVEEGTIGANARAIGAASGPILNQFLLNTNVGIAAG